MVSFINDNKSIFHVDPIKIIFITLLITKYLKIISLFLQKILSPYWFLGSHAKDFLNEISNILKKRSRSVVMM